MDTHEIVITFEDNMDDMLTVTCLDSGRWFWLDQEPVVQGHDFEHKWPDTTDGRAVFFMEGKDGCMRCSGHKHVVIGGVK